LRVCVLSLSNIPQGKTFWPFLEQTPVHHANASTPARSKRPATQNKVIEKVFEVLIETIPGKCVH